MGLADNDGMRHVLPLVALLTLSLTAVPALATQGNKGTPVVQPAEETAPKTAARSKADPAMAKLDRFVARYGMHNRGEQARRVERWRLRELARLMREDNTGTPIVATATKKK